MAFDSFSREFVLGKKRIIVPSSCIRTVVDPESGTLKQYFDADDEAFIALKADEPQDLKITDNTVDLRIEEHVSAINAMLNILCFQTGLSAGTLSFDAVQGMKTATEVISQDSKTARTMKGHKNLVKELFESLVNSIVALGVSLGDIPQAEYEVTISFNDNIIIDDNTMIDNNVKLVGAQLKSKLKAIMEVQKCDEATAKKEMAQIAKEQQVTGTEIDNLGDESNINSEVGSEINTNEVVSSVEETAGKTLNGAQTQSLVSIIEQYQSKALSIGQAINIPYYSYADTWVGGTSANPTTPPITATDYPYIVITYREQSYTYGPYDVWLLKNKPALVYNSLGQQCLYFYGDAAKVSYQVINGTPTRWQSNRYTPSARSPMPLVHAQGVADTTTYGNYMGGGYTSGSNCVYYMSVNPDIVPDGRVFVGTLKDNNYMYTNCVSFEKGTKTGEYIIKADIKDIDNSTNPPTQTGYVCVGGFESNAKVKAIWLEP